MTNVRSQRPETLALEAVTSGRRFGLLGFFGGMPTRGLSVHAGCAWVAALGLVLPNSLRAQTFPSPTRTDIPPSASLPATSIQPNSPILRIDEIEVELVWLANPATFPLNLGARATGSKLEVRGVVP